MICDWYANSKNFPKCTATAAEIWRHSCPECKKYKIRGLCFLHSEEVRRKLRLRVVYCETCRHHDSPDKFWTRIGDA